MLALQHFNLAGILLGEHRLNECQRHARQAMTHADQAGKPYIRQGAEHLRSLGQSMDRDGPGEGRDREHTRGKGHEQGDRGRPPVGPPGRQQVHGAEGEDGHVGHRAEQVEEPEEGLVLETIPKGPALNGSAE